MTSIATSGDIEERRRAVRRQPRSAHAHALLGMALQQHGRYREAVASQRRALALDPGLTDLHGILAAALYASGDYAAAAGQARRAVALAPGSIDALLLLGQACHAAGDDTGAAASFAQATAREPRHAAAWIGLGLSQQRAGRLTDAEASFRHAVAIDAGNAGHWRELGVVLQMQGRSDDALVALTRSQQLGAGDPLLLRALAQNHFDAGRLDQALRYAHQEMDVLPTPEAHSTLLFMLSHASEDPVELTRAHRAYGERWEALPRAAPPRHANTKDPLRRLRVGLVSADLRNHAVARFLEPVCALFPHSGQLEFFAYANHAGQDATTARLRAHLPQWRQITHLTDAQAEALIRRDAIDILVDLSGHSAGNRLPLFARKPAPIQATWIGYAGTTGLQAMDYLISDGFHLPEGRYDDQFSERIVRLPLIAPFLPPPQAPDVNPLPALANGYLTFGSFHRASKISRATAALWGALLRAMPTARLLLGGQQCGTEATVLGWLEQEGVERQRVLVRPRVPVPDYLAQHHEVDVCLSPFPYSGATTICHALWMGVPTLCTIGPTNASHAAVCYLAHLGLGSFLADDRASFVALGQFLGENTGTLAALRAGMRQRFLDSVVGYPGVTAAGIEYALRVLWQRWCNGEATAPLRVRLSDLEGDEQSAG